MRELTKPPWMLFLMLAVLPIALLPLPRFGLRTCLIEPPCMIACRPLLTVFPMLCSLQVVHEEFGIVEGLMTTVHATTGMSLLS